MSSIAHHGTPQNYLLMIYYMTNVLKTNSIYGFVYIGHIFVHDGQMTIYLLHRIYCEYGQRVLWPVHTRATWSHWARIWLRFVYQVCTMVFTRQTAFCLLL